MIALSPMITEPRPVRNVNGVAGAQLIATKGEAFYDGRKVPEMLIFVVKVVSKPRVYQIRVNDGDGYVWKYWWQIKGDGRSGATKYRFSPVEYGLEEVHFYWTPSLLAWVGDLPGGRSVKISARRVWS